MCRDRFGSVLIGTPFFFVIWLGIGFREEEVFYSGAIVTGLPGELQFDGVGEIVTSIDGNQQNDQKVSIICVVSQVTLLSCNQR